MRYEGNMIPFYFPKRMKRKQNPQKVKYEALSSIALTFARPHSLYLKKSFFLPNLTVVEMLKAR